MKKVLKRIAVLFLILVFTIAGLDVYLIKKPQLQAKKKIEGIEKVAVPLSQLTVPERGKVIGLGEATHGNAEFQDLKLSVLKVLVDRYDVDCFAMEMDYGEGVLLNDYIHGLLEVTSQEVMEHLSFRIYRTREIQNLIEWMREYNCSHAKDLSFYGFDLQNPEIDLKLILEFLEDHSIESFGLGEAFRRFLDGNAGFRDEELKGGFEKLDQLKKELEKNRAAYHNLHNYDRILGCIENVQWARELAGKYKGENGMVEGGLYRDQMMAKRVLEISGSLPDSRMMITGHNGHIGYAGNYTKTSGAFLREEMGDAYYAIGTDYFLTSCNMPDKKGVRSDHSFCSADILAYQAKELGTYYLDFSRAKEEPLVYPYIHGPIYMGSLGEGYSILNTILQDTVRLYCEPELLFDSMIFLYQCTPLNLLS